jgi:hypothetical protein
MSINQWMTCLGTMKLPFRKLNSMLCEQSGAIEPARIVDAGRDTKNRSPHKEKAKQKRKGTGTMAGSLKNACLAFSNNRRRGFALADVLRTGGDAQESQHRSHW